MSVCRIGIENKRLDMTGFVTLKELKGEFKVYRKCAIISPSDAEKPKDERIKFSI